MSLNRFFCRLNFLLYMCIFVLNLGDDIYRLLDIGNILYYYIIGIRLYFVSFFEREIEVV